VGGGNICGYLGSWENGDLRTSIKPQSRLHEKRRTGEEGSSYYSDKKTRKVTTHKKILENQKKHPKNQPKEKYKPPLGGRGKRKMGGQVRGLERCLLIRGKRGKRGGV